MKKIVLCNWRVIKAEPSGLFVWFDPDRESVELYEVEPLLEGGVASASEGDDQTRLFAGASSSDDTPVDPDGSDLPF